MEYEKRLLLLVLLFSAYSSPCGFCTASLLGCGNASPQWLCLHQALVAFALQASFWLWNCKSSVAMSSASPCGFCTASILGCGIASSNWLSFQCLQACMKTCKLLSFKPFALLIISFAGCDFQALVAVPYQAM